MTIIIEQGEPSSKFVKLLCHCFSVRYDRRSHLRLWFGVELSRTNGMCNIVKMENFAEEEWRENYMLWDVKTMTMRVERYV